MKGQWEAAFTTNLKAPCVILGKDNLPLLICQIQLKDWVTQIVTYEDGATESMNYGGRVMILVDDRLNSLSYIPEEIDNSLANIGFAYFDYGEEHRAILLKMHRAGIRGEQLYAASDLTYRYWRNQ